MRKENMISLTALRLLVEAQGPGFRQFLIEVGARAIARDNNMEPDFVAMVPHPVKKLPLPNWEWHADTAACIINEVFGANDPFESDPDRLRRLSEKYGLHVEPRKK